MYISVIALSVASVSMSIAWYASSRSLYVNSIDITIDADRMLEISTSKEDGYKDFINHSELEATGVFLPLTTAHSDEWMSLKKDMPVFYDESRSYEQENIQTYVECDSGYFSQKFYLKSDDDVWVTLDASRTFIDPNEIYNAKYAEKLYSHYQSTNDEHYKQYSEEELTEMLNRIVKAMRFSILYKDENNKYQYKIIDPYKQEETVLGGLLDNDVDQYYDFYLKEGSTDYYERVYGEVIGDQSLYVYDDGLANDSEYLQPNEAPNAFNARHKEGIKRFNLEKSIQNGIEFKKEEAYSLEDFSNSVTPFHFPVYMNEPKEVVVSIYIEGWDLDSVNYTMGAAFISNLSFKIEREM